MISPAWRHHNSVLQQQAASSLRLAVAAREREVIDQTAIDQAQFELLVTALSTDCKRLSEVPKGSARIPVKKTLIETYLQVVEKYVAAGAAYRNPVLTQVMVWCFDVGDIDTAMRLSRVAIAQQQPMPERFKRDIRTGVADLLLDWIGQVRAGSEAAPIEPYFSEIYNQIFPAEGIGWQIHDEIKLKYVKIAIGEAERRNDPRQALRLCILDDQIDVKAAQVKTKREKLIKQVAALDEEARRAGTKQ